MERTLIAGIETEAGRHLARFHAEHPEISGVSLSAPTSRISWGFQNPLQTAEAVRGLIRAESISRVIYCGDASVSGWSSQSIEAVPCSDTSTLQAWSAACAGLGIPFVFLSSDQQFNGPWVFHAEESESLAETPRAQSIRNQEAVVAEWDNSLIVRSHICGFSPRSLLADQLMSDANCGSAGHLWYATPIYAGRFAKLLNGLISRQTTGVYHLGGGERISRSHFLHRLDERFSLSSKFLNPESQISAPESAPLRETSLRSTKARRLLNEGLPSISDFLDDVAGDLRSGVAHDLAELSMSKVA